MLCRNFFAKYVNICKTFFEISQKFPLYVLMLVDKGVIMEIGFNPNVSFRAGKQPELDKTAKIQKTQTTETEKDSVDLSAVKEKKEKKHYIRNFIANVAKFFATTTEMVKGTVKGTAYGLASGAAILGGSWLFSALPRGFRKGGSIKDICKNPLKNIGTKSKVIAGVATLAVGSYHIIAAKLRANQKTANVDHQLKTGHRPV